MNSCAIYPESSVLNFPRESTLRHRFRCVCISQGLKERVVSHFANQSILEESLGSHLLTLIPPCTRIGGVVDRAIIKTALVDCVRLEKSAFIDKWVLEPFSH